MFLQILILVLTFLLPSTASPGLTVSEAQEAWNNPNYTTFLLLKPETNVAALSKKIDAWVNPPGESNQSASQNSLHLRLEPLKDVHFDTQVFNFKNEISSYRL